VAVGRQRWVFTGERELVGLLERELVGEADCLKDGGELVVAVPSAADDFEREVDLGGGGFDHRHTVRPVAPRVEATRRRGRDERLPTPLAAGPAEGPRSVRSGVRRTKRGGAPEARASAGPTLRARGSAHGASGRSRLPRAPGRLRRGASISSAAARCGAVSAASRSRPTLP